MILNRRALVLALSTSMLPFADHANAGGPAAAHMVVPALAPSWPHQGSDLQPDPGAQFGELANGMRYVFYRNATPPGQVAIYLRIGLGDLMEAQNENGLAHFIEHMAFNGTTNIPEGELVRILERQGLAFGRDTNAFTAPDQTVYQFNISSANEGKIDTALMVMREIASEIQFGPEAIERERGIIQSEDRSMYAPPRRAGVLRDQFLYRGQLLATRLDIGDLEVIRTAPRERFVNLYRRYYRPERATLVIVGDIDPAALEPKLRARFGDWRGNGPAGTDPDEGTPAPRQLEAGSAVIAGAPREFSVSYIRPFVGGRDSRSDRIAEYRELLTIAVLNRRLQRIAERPEAPFSTAFSFFVPRYQSLEQTIVQVQPKLGQEDAAARVLEQEIRRLKEHGVLDSELQREVLDRRTAMQATVASAATIPTPELALSIIFSVSARSVLLAPAQRLALFEEAARGFTAAQARQIARALFAGSGPLLFATSPDPIAGGHNRLAQAFSEAAQTPVEPPVALAVKPWPYERFGPVGRVAQREEIGDLGATRVRFDNGVTLVVKPTQFEAGRVQINVRIGGGRLALVPELVTLPLAQGGFARGGLEQLNEEEIREALAGRVTSTSFSVEDDGILLGGSTRPEDFAIQLQLLAAYVAHPGWRADGFERTRSLMLNFLSTIGSSPMNTALTQYPRLVRSGDGRWGWPTGEELAAAQLAPLRAAIDPMLGSAPLEIVVVGDVTTEEAIGRVGATFGALPRRDAQPPRLPSLEHVAFPQGGTTTRLQHTGRPDVAFGMVAWPTDDFYDDPSEARALQVLRSLAQIRAIEKLREEMGATYSPVARQESSELFDEFGVISIGAEVNPAQLNQLLQVIGEVAGELKMRAADADELARAKEPMLLALANDRNTNGWWLARLSGSTWDSRRLESIRNQEQGLRTVTSADLTRLARKYLSAERAYRLVVDPTSARSS